MSEIEKEIAASGSGDEDEELEQMKARVREMEAEAEKLRTMTAQAQPGSGPGSVGSGGGDMGTEFGEESAEIVDARSVYVGNVSFRIFARSLMVVVYGFWHRSIMGPRPKSSRRISKPWGRLIGSPSCATSLRGIQKGLFVFLGGSSFQ
jgi:hypothetical protein